MATIPAALSEPLPAMAIAGRLDRLRTRLSDTAAAATAAPDSAPADPAPAIPANGILVTSLTNIRYLTGFTGSAGVLVVGPNAATLITDGRYEEQAADQLAASGATAEIDVVPGVKQAEAARAAVDRAGVTHLGLESAHVTWAAVRRYQAGALAGVELVATVGAVEGLRRIKDDGEVARIARAAAIADEALARVRPGLGDGPTEAEFALELDATMRRLGATGPSFETIVASGANAAKPHHRPSHRRIVAGEAIVIDFGAWVDGYASDMTRTVWVDDVRDPDIRRAVGVVADAQAAGVAAVAAGVEAAAVDRVCREVIAGAGWADRFVHGTGHGVGLDIHEAPSVASSSTDTLAARQVVTVEPGVYLSGIGGVRIEDTVSVTEDGCRTLTLSPKDRC